MTQGAVLEEDSPRDLPFPRLDPARPGKALTEDQAAGAAGAAHKRCGTERYGTTLLRGVTGSGKTEVYLEAVAACLAAGRQALVLLARDRPDGGISDTGRRNGSARNPPNGIPAPP